MSNLQLDQSIPTHYGIHLGDDELCDEARNWRKLRKHLIWMSVFEKHILGDDVHEMLLFVDGKAAACDEAIEARLDEDDDGDTLN